MTRIIHLTDLHFGQERHELLAPLRTALRAQNAELVVVSGDLAHRARRAQFRRAMGFLNSLELPFVSLPGNHDIPLRNLFLRFIRPFAAYRREVAQNMTPLVSVGAVRIICANTADPFRWRRGRLNRADHTRITTLLRSAPKGSFDILACHHPFTEPPGFERGETKGASAALSEFGALGLKMILSGHLHHWAIGLGITAQTPQPVLQVQTGTALCGRAGEHDHGFSVIDISVDAVTITPWIIDRAVQGPGTEAPDLKAPQFQAHPPRRFHRRDGHWFAAEPA